MKSQSSHIGNDLVSLTRIKKILDENSDSFLSRICTRSEKSRLDTEKRKVEKVAGLYALKEAFAKALGTGVGEHFSFLDVEVSYSKLGKPLLQYVGERFRYDAGLWHISASLSHEGDLVSAVVFLDGEVNVGL